MGWAGWMGLCAQLVLGLGWSMVYAGMLGLTTIVCPLHNFIKLQQSTIVHNLESVRGVGIIVSLCYPIPTSRRPSTASISCRAGVLLVLAMLG